MDLLAALLKVKENDPIHFAVTKSDLLAAQKLIAASAPAPAADAPAPAA